VDTPGTPERTWYTDKTDTHPVNKLTVAKNKLLILLFYSENLIKMINWHIGCSGFHYKHWRGSFYPEDLPQRKWFDFYCEHFRTLELNVTFYRFPQLSFLQNWHQQSPADFRFSVKAPRAITHYKKFLNSADMLTSFYDTINNGLQEKLGPVLFQLPPNFTYSPERLERVITAVNPHFKNVIEFRHTDWWREDVYKLLAEHGITFCGMSHPSLPDDIVQNNDLLYYRFHGVPNLYSSPYSAADLQKVVDTVKQSKTTKEAWFYFNNDVNTSAIGNAKEMVGMVC
jgi:uncharacterized protein YecE (DUF72 family)